MPSLVLNELISPLYCNDWLAVIGQETIWSVLIGRSFSTSRFNRLRTNGFMILFAWEIWVCSKGDISASVLSIVFFAPTFCNFKFTWLIYEITNRYNDVDNEILRCFCGIDFSDRLRCAQTNEASQSTIMTLILISYFAKVYQSIKCDGQPKRKLKIKENSTIHNFQLENYTNVNTDEIFISLSRHIFQHVSFVENYVLHCRHSEHFPLFRRTTY